MFDLLFYFSDSSYSKLWKLLVWADKHQAIWGRSRGWSQIHKTTFCTEQNEFMDKKFVILGPQAILTQYLLLRFCIKTSIWSSSRRFWTVCEHSTGTGQITNQVVRLGEIRPPLLWFLEWQNLVIVLGVRILPLRNRFCGQKSWILIFHYSKVFLFLEVVPIFSTPFKF